MGCFCKTVGNVVFLILQTFKDNFNILNLHWDSKYVAYTATTACLRQQLVALMSEVLIPSINTFLTCSLPP